jgi:5-methylcytosine-specific restriction endonuclease McrA
MHAAFAFILKDLRHPDAFRTLHRLGWHAVRQIEDAWRESTDGRFSRYFYEGFRRALWRTAEYQEFRHSTLDLAGGVCARCKEPKPRLEVHHRLSWWGYPQKRMDPTNVEALCVGCHDLAENSPRWRIRRGIRRGIQARKRRHQCQEA